MTETLWFILILWLGLIAFSKKSMMIGASSGIIGVLFGLLLIQGVNEWLGITVVFMSIYLLYEAIMGEQEKK